MQHPPDIRRRKRSRRILMILAGLVLVYTGCSQNFFAKWVPRDEVFHAHMYWNSYLSALDLPEGQDYPIPVGNELIDARTGEVLQQLDWLDSNYYFCRPVSGEPGVYVRALPPQAGEDFDDPAWHRTFDSRELVYSDAPPANRNPASILEIFDLVVERDTELSIVRDRDGVELFRLAEWIVTGIRVGDEFVLLADTRTIRVSRDGRIRWETTVTGTDNRSAGAIELLDDGDLLVLHHSPRADDFERVVRLSSDTGETDWVTRFCGRLAVSHSAYYHFAYFDVRGDYIFVVGQASSGHIVTVLDLASGWEQRRWIYQFD